MVTMVAEFCSLVILIHNCPVMAVSLIVPIDLYNPKNFCDPKNFCSLECSLVLQGSIFQEEWSDPERWLTHWIPCVAACVHCVGGSLWDAFGDYIPFTVPLGNP